MELEKIIKIIADVMDADAKEITPETTFVDGLGATSLDLFQIIMLMEEAFDIEISTDDAERMEKVGDAVEAVQSAASFTN